MARLPTTELVKRPRSHGFHARLDGVYVRLGPSEDAPYVMVAPEAEAPRVNTAQSPEEFVQESGQVWSRANFTGGEGLAFAHREDQQPFDARRFWAACTVMAPISDPGSPLWVELGPEWAPVSGVPGDHVAVVPFASGEVAVIGESGYTIFDELADAGGAEIVTSGVLADAVAADWHDEYVYVVHGSTTVTRLRAQNVAAETLSAPGGAWTRIWHAKGRLFLAAEQGGSLWEWEPGTDPVQVIAERVITPTQSWTKVIDAGMYVAASATDGRIYLFAPSSIAQPDLHVVSSTPMPQGEEISDIAFNQGILVIGTGERRWTDDGTLEVNGRLYVAHITDEISDVQLVRRWTDRSDPRPRGMLTTRDAVFWTFTGDGSAEVWQIVLPTLGLFRHGIFSVDTPVVDLANPGQTGVLATRNAVFIERTWRAQGGWMILPAVDFYTASLKSWTEVRVSASHVGAAGEIEVLYSTDPDAMHSRNHDSWLTVARLRNGQTEMRVPMRGVSSRYLLLQVRWVRNADRSSPRLLAVSLVGRTDDRDMIQMRLPVIVSDRVERPYRTPVRVRGYGQLLRQWLFDLKGASVNVELFRPELSVIGTVTAVEAPVQVINRRGQVLDVATVIVHGRRMTSLASSQFGSQESLGLGLLGVSPVLGGVEGA